MNAEAWGHYRPQGLQQVGLAICRSGIKHRGLRRAIRRALVKHAQQFDVTRGGIKLRCQLGDNLTERDIVFGGRFDNAKEMAVLLDRLQPGDTFVDVGANCGVFSLGAAKRVGEAGRVIAIEPNPAMVERLKFNIAANGFGNIDVVECAIGDAAGTAQLQVCAREMGRSSMAVRVDGPRLSVPVWPLPDVLAQRGVARIDAMKIDIEGFEDRAIMPMLRAATPAIWPRAILIEKVHAHLWRDGCVHHMIEAGYRVEWESSSDVLLTR